jgi:hypothetical protein
MLTFDQANPGCVDSDIESLRRRAAPATWPEDHIAFLRAHDGGVVSVNAFPIHAKLSDTIAKIYSVADILCQKTMLSARTPSNVWPIADTASGNFIVFVVSDGWSLGFFDHETEEIIELARTFTLFSTMVGDPPRPRLQAGQLRAITVSEAFAEKFARFKKKT